MTAMDQITLTRKYEVNEANLIHREVWEQPTRDASRGRFSSYQHIQHPRSQSKGEKQNNHQTTLNIASSFSRCVEYASIAIRGNHTGSQPIHTYNLCLGGSFVSWTTMEDFDKENKKYSSHCVAGVVSTHHHPYPGFFFMNLRQSAFDAGEW